MESIRKALRVMCIVNWSLYGTYLLLANVLFKDIFYRSEDFLYSPKVLLGLVYGIIFTYLVWRLINNK